VVWEDAVGFQWLAKVDDFERLGCGLIFGQDGRRQTLKQE
jgi:hypothetical protein